ncbi:MAG: hypothetical protein KDD11_02250 [Acidobacteria bacterium]|nr:hypothetical protein [Acidobacteriota bacterium]
MKPLRIHPPQFEMSDLLLEGEAAQALAPPTGDLGNTTLPEGPSAYELEEILDDIARLCSDLPSLPDHALTRASIYDPTA